MYNNINSSIFIDNTPIVKIMVSELEISIKVLFSIDCYDKMSMYLKNGDNYRLAFAKVVFYMYEHTEFNSKVLLTEKDFINMSDNDLITILNIVLEQDEEVKVEYEKQQIKDVYECFCNANLIVIESSKNNIYKKLESTSKILNNSFIESNNKLNMAFAQSLEIHSIFRNISQPILELRNAIVPINNIFNNLNNSLVQKIKTPLEQTYELMQDLISSILTYNESFSNQRDKLLEYDWIYTQELPNELVNRIYEKESGLTKNDVDKLIVIYFRQNRYTKLKGIVESWVELPYFKCRKIIFHEAFLNHIRKCFNTSITLLTIHTEGVISDFNRISLQEPKFYINKAIKDIKEELYNSSEIPYHEAICFYNILSYIEEIFKEKFKPYNPDETSNKSRNKIAHGHAYEKESEANSLKQFLYLNEIYKLFVKLVNP